MEKFIIIGGMFPENKIDEIILNSNGVIDFAAHNFQKKIIKGLSDNDIRWQLISVPFISSFPKYYKKKIIDFQNNNNSNITFLKYTNVPYIKIFSRYYSLKNKLKKMYKVDREKEYVFLIYSLHLPFLANALFIKKKFKKCKICLVVPDLLEYMSDNSSLKYKLLKKIESSLTNKFMKKIDCFVLLTEMMNERVNVYNKPYTIIEGIADPLNSEDFYKNESLDEKYLLYTGTLAKRYGITLLVDAFMQIKRNDIKLYICGSGDAVDYINDACSKNKNIVYLGQVSPNVAKEYQRKAYALINPRLNIDQFTKYSFPSKIMEYISMGKPVICYKLDGYPQEYNNVLIYPENNDVVSLTNCIETVFNFSNEELECIKKRSIDFMLEKTPKNMVKKILKLLKE